MIIHIYILINPINKQVFYVGATKNTNSRLKAHIKSAIYGSMSFKSKIIRQILESNFEPEIVSIDTCSIEKASDTEEFYIELFKFYGFKLRQNERSGYSSFIKKKSLKIKPLAEKISVQILRETYELAKLFSGKNDLVMCRFIDRAIKEKIEKEKSKQKL